MKYKKVNLIWLLTIGMFTIALIIPFIVSVFVDDINYFISYLLSFLPALAMFFFSIAWRARFFKPRLGFKVPKEVQGEIRLSYSSLIRIKHKEHYLLVSGNNDKYQPPGGVYHYYEDFMEKEFGFKKDKMGDAKDIRGKININQVKKFLDWINSFDSTYRETTPKREFEEELINTDILSKDVFKEYNLEFVEQKYKNGKIDFSKHYQIYELIIFDIYKLKLNDKQKEYLEVLMQKENDANYTFGNYDNIIRRGVTDSDFKAQISDHAVYVLEGYIDEL